MDKHTEHLQDGWKMDHAVADVVLDDLAFYQTLIVNVCMIGKENSNDWVLIDTGIRHYGERIMEMARKRFGGHPPKAIILTHGHFDHVGSAVYLAKHWDVPIFVHPMEWDYVTGKRDYPVGDATVGGGFFALISPFYPTKAVNLARYVEKLPEDGSLPHLPDWKYVHTPGHTPGHIALFREKDRALIAGDAFITVKQESAFGVFTQHQKVHGPPAYFTPNWKEAEKSVQKLAELKPSVAITGHGLAMEGERLNKQLQELAANFKELAIPKHKRNVH
ncbi:MBL fold metallo-hydrolase [Thalassobacillus pellis]|uniref:MBL fold metallo-hydrolase n=1 Tax=Thalassobacillus pellis TaxID=748008 RepID=UPI0019614496|nr:MBL fold metallo-hydrolase [Thalassobacillus pellis]MBM7551137.1 glyoxylase-like metal-dependent hydrolase (beta-lactamase superfamily II) [Thalassobacillus pellis]